MSEVVHVIGSGVVGLGSALYFAERGHEVHVYSDSDYYFATSRFAAAFWYPYACSLTDDEARELASPTLAFFDRYKDNGSNGIEFRKGCELFDESVSAPQREPPWWQWESVSTHFEEIREAEMPTHWKKNTSIGPFTHGWRFIVPVVNTAKFLPWLKELTKLKGVRFFKERVETLDSHCRECSVVVNCTGGWSTWLTVDPLLVGYQGVLVEVPGEPFGDELLFCEKGNSQDFPAYIVPQTVRTILGGTLQPRTDAGSRWEPGNTTLWTPSKADIQDVIDRCRSLVPNAPDVGQNYKATAALRPRRQGSPPRIEAELNDDAVIIHNYGHGGSGITTFWGSAMLAYKLYKQSLSKTRGSD